ncbi:GNAT family N-acetyltransferase [Rossellomorea vietnamensis]|uniref:GNAT family N-acetyltransferase n=1 Tax=Rossellomorea vietnamensis TaxID=218284 RepID=A0ACD4C8U6_9BACI|nr:GNAT family N-acetyltransferase [Rossellomorea vietnamensis]UXH44022.1 GNAT family N-acetyltransferase [Rossellomorea vietnamensis]
MMKKAFSSDLMARIKLIKGENFVTVENTKNLTDQELIQLIPYLMRESSINTCKNVNILVDSQCSKEVDSLLKEYEFTLHDEHVTVHKVLDESSNMQGGFTLKNLHDLPLAEFKKVWEASMEGSLNSPSSLNIDEQMRSVEVELGPNYKKSCMVAYENGTPIGVTMPHIEPGTLEEGRIFYFGILPSERGKGKSKLLHQQSLEILKKDFNASYYIGSTGHNNLPMLKTFQNNGCTVIERNKVFKRKN